MALTIDERPAQPGEWGFRPENVTTEETPPAFVWRPQEKAASYDIQCARGADFSEIAYEARGIDIYGSPRRRRCLNRDSGIGGSDLSDGCRTGVGLEFGARLCDCPKCKRVAVAQAQ